MITCLLFEGFSAYSFSDREPQSAVLDSEPQVNLSQAWRIATKRTPSWSDRNKNPDAHREHRGQGGCYKSCQGWQPMYV